MSLTKSFRILSACAGVMVATMIAAGPASAQSIFFDWGSNETVNDSGRELVNFEDKAKPGELIVSFGDRRVYFLIAPGRALSYPIAVPREQSKWAGVTTVSAKKVNPSWTPTPEMMIENPRLPPWVPGGHPMNPLGTHAMYLGASAYRIHGTDAPWTIGTAASKGCVRMYNKDVQDLYPRVPIGTKVTVTYQTYHTTPLDGDTAKGLFASLDKGKKVSAGEDVAASAEAATKKWHGDDSGDSAPVHKAAANADEAVADKQMPEKAPDEKHASNKSDAVKTADHDVKSEQPSEHAKTAHEKHTVETGSVDKVKSEPDAKKEGKSDEAVHSEVHIKADAKSDAKAEGKSEAKSETKLDTKPEAKEHVASKEKPEAKAHKPDDDAATVANRALAAAERAAAAAERAADAAERASAAAVKATTSGERSGEPGEPAKSAEAQPMPAWPVVHSANP